MSELTKREAAAVVVATQPQTMLEAVMRVIAQPGMTPEVARQYLELGKELEAIAAKKQFSLAMAALKPELPVIKKNGLISYKPGTKPTQFAKWDDIYRACMPILAAHGFTCSFSSELQNGNALMVYMTVRHIGGHEERGSLVVPWLDNGGSKSPAQAAASSFTVAQRHVFVKYFDVLTEDQDDDGTGRGTSDRITESQSLKLADIMQECENRQSGFTARFNKWLKIEFGVDSVVQLFQGDQLKAVQQKLAEKMRELGVK